MPPSRRLPPTPLRFVLGLAGLSLLGLAGCAPQRALPGDGGFRPLWDGRTFAGWHPIGGGTWTIEDGALVGRNVASEPRHGHLVTDERYGDFTVRLRFKALAGNSGLYFRIEKTEGDVGVAGFQAEIDAAQDVGGLYETAGRAWVIQPTAEEVRRYFRPGDWNEMVVSARGGDVTVFVNGTRTAALEDDPGRTAGYLALQLHGSQDVEVHFKDLEISGRPVR